MRGMRCSKRARARNHIQRDYLGPAGRGRSVLWISRQPLRRVSFWRTCRRWHLGCCGSRVATGGRLWLKVVSVGIRNRTGRFCCHAAVSRVGDGNCSATPSLSDFSGPRPGGRTAKCVINRVSKTLKSVPRSQLVEYSRVSRRRGTWLSCVETPPQRSQGQASGSSASSSNCNIYDIYNYWCRFLRIELGARSFHHLQEGPAHPRTVSIEVNFAQKGTSTDEVATTHGVLPLLL